VTTDPALRPLISAIQRVDDDPAAFADLLRAAGPTLASELGETFRLALAELPVVYRDDPLVASLIGMSFRVGPTASPSAAAGYHHAARMALGARPDTAPFDAATILLNAAAGERVLGHLDSARAIAGEARGIIESDAVSSIPQRMSLNARLAHELGVIELDLGRFDEAGGHLHFAVGTARMFLSRAEVVECFGVVALMDFSRGRLDQAVHHVTEARALAAGSSVLASSYFAPAAAAEALVAAERREVESARESFERSAGLARHSEWEPFFGIIAAQLAAYSRRPIEALDLLMQAEQLYASWQPRGMASDLGVILRASLLMSLGQGDEAWRALEGIEPYPRHALCPGRFRARLALLTGDLDLAERCLEDCEALGDAHMPRTYMDVLLMRAAIEAERGNWVRADVAFDRALFRMASSGTRTPLGHVPGSIAQRMLGRASARPQSEVVVAYLASLDGTRVGPDRPVEPVSDRERVILAHLERGLTVTSIAREMYVSPNTIKTHLQRMYRKLGVNTRDEAIQKAHSLGLNPGVTR
jgi:LuxR family maltose regulon positive regulatory protein